MRWWCLWSRVRGREMICGVSLIEKRGPTCRDPRGSGEGQRDREDFEHGLDHLGKIFTWVLLQGSVKRLEGAASEGGRDRAPTINEKCCGCVRRRNVVSGDPSGYWMEKQGRGASSEA